MSKQLRYFLFIFNSLTIQVNAQDIHWSQFNDNQIFQNPGNAGDFKGDYRIIANYRDQWRSVSVPFQTISFSGDTHYKKNNKVGIGALLFNDVSGDGKFRTVELQSNFSYLLKIKADSTHTIRPGINIGINHRQVNFDQFSFDNQFVNNEYDPSSPSFESFQNQKKTNFSLGLGAVYQYWITDRKKINVGIGIFNINRPNQGFYAEKVQRDIRTSLFLKGIYEINEDWDILPSISFQTQGKYKEFILGSSAKYTLIDKLGAYRAVYFGGWFRNKDAGYLSVGLDNQNWFCGLSYDFNVSKLVPASNFRGGFELAARYIIHRFKPKKITHRACPDYI